MKYGLPWQRQHFLVYRAAEEGRGGPGDSGKRANGFAEDKARCLKVSWHERFPAAGATWYAPQAFGQLRNRLRHNPVPSRCIYQETFPSEAI
jgi:hypothetical protein